MSVSVRQSNFELLRILCMFGVIINHALQNLYTLHTPAITMPSTFRIALMNLCIVAVNCFVMISGYFGIKASVKGIMSLYFQLLFYACIGFVVCCFFNADFSFWVGLKRILFPLSESGLWFITAYIALYVLAPLLNVVLDRLSSHQLILALVALFAVDVYLGYEHQAKEVTQDGYHLQHFVTLYFLGAALKAHSSAICRNKWGGKIILLLIIGTALHAVKMRFPPIAVIYSMRYNSPFVMLMSISVFSAAMKWHIQSAKINAVARSVLSIYIISSTMPVYYEPLNWLKARLSPSMDLIAFPLFIVMFFFSCIVFDQLRLELQKMIVPRILPSIELFAGKLLKRISRL